MGAAPAGGPRCRGGADRERGGRDGARMNLERLRKRVRHYIDQVSATGAAGLGRHGPGFSTRKNRSRRGSRTQRERGRGGAGSGAGLCDGGEGVILLFCNFAKCAPFSLEGEGAAGPRCPGGAGGDSWFFPPVEKEEGAALGLLLARVDLLDPSLSGCASGAVLT